VTAIDFQNDTFNIKCQKGATFQAKVVLGSFGKRSNLDKTLNRHFFSQPTDYLGVKHFFEGDFPKDLVALYNFDGGYCGAIQVEDKSISVAYLTKHQYLKKYGSLQKMEEALLYKNPILKKLFTQNKPLLERPQTISNVSFQHKEIVQNHVLMIGDAAGMIAPVCGNGMAMGIHGAKIASDLVLQFLDGQIDRNALEQNFEKQWKKVFGKRVFWGRQIQKFMGQPQLSEIAVKTLHVMPAILPTIINRTHGKPV
jgi:flavin-dependent dehydrogenase